VGIDDSYKKTAQGTDIVPMDDDARARLLAAASPQSIPSIAISHLEAGYVFANDYQVVRELARGGMGVVYVAQQLSTGKPRALKLMLPEMVRDPSLRRRFESEARISAKIQIDHVVEIIAAGVDGATGTPWLAMELCSRVSTCDPSSSGSGRSPATPLVRSSRSCFTR